MCDEPWLYPSQAKLAKLFYKNFYHPRNDFDEVSTIVDSLCKVYARAHVHLPMFNESENIYNCVDNVMPFGNYTSYLAWCRNNNFQEKVYGHYGSDAHQKLAKLIIDYIEGKHCV
jgi:hypothetical protein